MSSQAVTPDLLWFENIWRSLDSLYHKELVLEAPAEFKNRFYRDVMPAVMTLGRDYYSCRKVFHPTMTC